MSDPPLLLHTGLNDYDESSADAAASVPGSTPGSAPAMAARYPAPAGTAQSNPNYYTIPQRSSTLSCPGTTAQAIWRPRDPHHMFFFHVLLSGEW
jgi:hypothetical protein